MAILSQVEILVTNYYCHPPSSTMGCGRGGEGGCYKYFLFISEYAHMGSEIDDGEKTHT